MNKFAAQGDDGIDFCRAGGNPASQEGGETHRRSLNERIREPSLLTENPVHGIGQRVGNERFVLLCSNQLALLAPPTGSNQAATSLEAVCCPNVVGGISDYE